MSSTSQDIRCSIILDHVGQLIESLTGLTPAAGAKYAHLEHWSLARFRQHKFLSVNGHEVQRQLDILGERMSYANFEPYARHLSALSDRLRTDPLCAEHYETDIHWALVDFLLAVASNPVAGLERRRSNRTLRPPSVSETQLAVRAEVERKERAERDRRALLADLMAENFRGAAAGSGTGKAEVLSDWSDLSSDEELDHNNHPIPKPPVAKTAAPSNNATDADAATPTDELPTAAGLLSTLPDLQPPAKPAYFAHFDARNSRSWLAQNVQAAWWHSDAHIHQSVSRHAQAHFCHTWLDLCGRNDPPPTADAVSTISEYCLQREILWLFSDEPASCKAFRVDWRTATVSVAEHVSINSVSVPALRSALEYFARLATIHMRLQRFCERVAAAAAASAATPMPRTYECYAQALAQCMQPFRAFVAHAEHELCAQRLPSAGRPRTLLRLQRDMAAHTPLLRTLYDVHTAATAALGAAFERVPAHVCAAHLIGALLAAHERSATRCRAHVAAALLMHVLRVYLGIIELWWTSGRLEDWREEFVIRNSAADQLAPAAPVSLLDCVVVGAPSSSSLSPNGSRDFEQRTLSKRTRHSLQLSGAVTDTMAACPVLQMLCRHSLQAGYTLNVLHALQRIAEMQRQCGYQANLFSTFCEETLERLAVFERPTAAAKPPAAIVSTSAAVAVSPIRRSPNRAAESVAAFRRSFTAAQRLLVDAFEPSLKRLEQPAAAAATDADDAAATASDGGGCLRAPAPAPHDAYALYLRFERIAGAGSLLPIGDAIRDTLAGLLRTRIAAANRCVISMYRTEFQVREHLHNLRRVFLLEASDLMFQFYTGLFAGIELAAAGGGDAAGWCNTYLLTDQLNGLLCSKYPDMSDLFTVHASDARRAAAGDVCDALRCVRVAYAAAPCMRDIIGEPVLRRYNEVLRFLLRLKWGLWSLEQLRHPAAQRRRRPYARQTYHGRTFKRLQLARIWILYSMQCVHNHVMTHVVQVEGGGVDAELERCETLAEMVAVHERFVARVWALCFLQPADRPIWTAVEQLLRLIGVVRAEWRYLERVEEEAEVAEMAGDTQIDKIECSYINWHAFVVGVLQAKVHKGDREELSSLLAAFTCSCPY